MPAADLDRAVYAGVAGAKDDAETDILAGIAGRIVARQPEISAAELSEAIAAAREVLLAHRPLRQDDLAVDSAVKMSLLLTRAVPVLTSPLLREAARDYTRAFLDSHRRGASLLRQVAPIALQFDRFDAVAQFREDTWRRLHDAARALPAVAEAIDNGPIAETLGVRTGQDALSALTVVPLEPLKTFVANRIQPGGALLVTRDDIDTTLKDISSTVIILVNSYSENVVVVTKGQEDEGNLSEFEKLIKKAEEKQKELDETLDTAAKGAKSVFGLSSFAATQFGDTDLAADIDEYKTILLKMLNATKEAADGAIRIAKAIAGLDDIKKEDVFKTVGLGLNFAMLALVLKISGLFAKSKPPTQIILEQLREIRKTIFVLRDEMRARFDRIETRLNTIYSGILDRLEEMDFDLGQIEGSVEELQHSLLALHGEVQRLTRDVQALLEAAHRRVLVEAVNGFLRFRERTGEDLSVEAFREAENIFFTWGHDHAKDILQAGADDRDFADDTLLQEITSVPVATNVNYLRQFPDARFTLAPLSPVRLANPFDWIVAGEAYAQLGEESPAQPVSQQRVQDLIGVGEAVGVSLSRIADDALFAALHDHYVTSFATLAAAIGAAEGEFRVDANHQLRGIDLWGGADQPLASHPLDGESFKELRRCDGSSKGFGGGHDTAPVPPSIGRDFDYSILRPYMIASNLRAAVTPGVADGLSTLSPCVQARWEVQETGPAPGNKVRVVYRCHIDVLIRYGPAVVFAHRYRTNEILQLLVPKDKFENGTFDPATDPIGKDPHTMFFEDDDDDDKGENLWARLDTFEVTHVLVNAALRTETIALVERKLSLLQRVFYADIVRRFTRAGDDVQKAGAVLTGSKLLWQAFVTTGLPLSIEGNEFLRALLFGSDGILGGVDADTTNRLLDDVQALYAFFSAREEDPPATNIIGNVEALVTDRAGRLAALLQAIVAAIDSSGEPEPPELFAPTLLRLRLLL